MMCTQIILDGIHLLTMGQLRAAIGDVPVLGSDSEPIPDHFCLCPVDFDALVQSGKFTYVEGDDPFVVYLQSATTPMEKT
jgi:hypothetical protein